MPTTASTFNALKRISSTKQSWFNVKPEVFLPVSSSSSSAFRALKQVKPSHQVLFNIKPEITSVTCSFNAHKKIITSRGSLFNVLPVKTTVTSTFNTYTRRQGLSTADVTSGFFVLYRVSTTATMEWNEGMPVQEGIRLIPSARWIPMYPS